MINIALKFGECIANMLQRLNNKFFRAYYVLTITHFDILCLW